MNEEFHFRHLNDKFNSSPSHTTIEYLPLSIYLPWKDQDRVIEKAGSHLREVGHEVQAHLFRLRRESSHHVKPFGQALARVPETLKQVGSAQHQR